MQQELGLVALAVGWMCAGSVGLGVLLFGGAAGLLVGFTALRRLYQSWWERAAAELGLEQTAEQGRPVLRGEVDGRSVRVGINPSRRSSRIRIPVWEAVVEVPELTVPVVASPRSLIGNKRRPWLRIEGAGPLGDPGFDARNVARIAPEHRAWLTADRLASLAELLRTFDNVELGEGCLRASSTVTIEIQSGMADAVRLALRHASRMADGAAG